MADDADSAGQLSESDDAVGDDDAEGTADGVARQGRSTVRLALAVGLVAVLSVAGLVGWLGYRTQESQQTQRRTALFLQVGRQAAVNLTTISYTEADADLRRILDSSTGALAEDFQKRSRPFVDAVKQAQSKSEGTVTAAGLESQAGDEAQVLVAVSVKTTNTVAPEQEPRLWRMRIKVRQIGDDAKVSDVEFVP